MKRIYLLLCMGLILATSEGLAQDLIRDTSFLNVLVFEHYDKKQTKLVSQGGTIKYRLWGNPKATYSGVLQEIHPKYMIVNGQKVAYTDCSMIKARVRSERDMVGGLLVGSGATTLAVGGALLTTSVSGFAIIGAGLTAAAAGVVLVSAKRKFDFNKGWEVYGGKIVFQRALN